ncbi:alpha-2-macroglobulin family protein [Moheibacter lacus]|nr:alpha-2-macroglobulin family protein [Moheibacter lacus]
MAQKKFDYETRWKQIETQEDNGLLKSTLSTVNEIYTQAKKDENSQQIIRSLLYKSKIAIATSDDENVELDIVEDFENELATANSIDRAILNSILAELYKTYYRENQWEINERTETLESTGKDFRFWTESVFRKKSAEFYLKSIENQKELQNEPIENWDYLLNKSTETRNLRPTLYDLLAHRAIQFFQTQRNYYYRSNFNAEDEKFKEEKIKAIYADLIAFHQQKNNADALLYNKLELLKFNKKDLSDAEFEQKLLELKSEFPSTNYTAYLLLELANFYKNQVNNSDENDFEKRKELTENALRFAKEITEKFPKSLLSSDAKSIIGKIESPDFDIQIEFYVSPNQVNPISVTHKNLNQLFFKIYRIEADQMEEVQHFLNNSYHNRLTKLDTIFHSLKLEKEFSINLNSFDDYQFHRTTGKMEALPSGNYILLAYNQSDFQLDKKDFVLKSQMLNVSDYSIVFRNQEILVANRKTGTPAVNQQIEIYSLEKGKRVLSKTITTDEFGKADVNPSKINYNNYTLKIKGENVEYNHYFYNYNQNKDNSTHTSTKFFTDRAIYRPGQTVYFKAIVYEENQDGKRAAVKNEENEIILYDPNGEEIATLELKTNEFGSIAGEFVLPNGGLTGEYYLEDDYGDTYYFSVEEYKRPKFEVEFDTIKETFKLEQKVIAKGKAMSFSGANVDNAKVVYRVYRQAIYPYWPWWKRGTYPQNEPAEEIAFGETTTDSDGKFEVEFTAKPAVLGAEETRSPRTYTYRVTAEVTDINGETRTSEQSITVGDLRYKLEIPVAEKINLDEWDSIPFNTQNLSGEFVPAKGKITLTKINPPDRVLRKTPFQQTNYEVYSKAEFVNYFPHEPYGDEMNPENWEKETPILNESFDTNSSKSLKINPKKWKEGTYILKGFIIDDKDTIPNERMVQLFRTKKEKPIENEIFTVNQNKTTFQPGDKAEIQFASAAENSTALVELEHDGKIIKKEKIQLNNEVKNFSFPIEESYRGNVFVHYYFGKFNTAASGTLSIQVPQKDTSLKITTSSLRDKLTPGQEETWELTVSGADKDKVLAEMVATMYDASLDQFRTNSIDFPMKIGTNQPQFRGWETYQSFMNIGLSPIIENPYRYYQSNNYLAFDEFNWFGFGWNVYRLRQYMSKRKSVNASEPTVADMLQGQVAGLAAEESSDGQVELEAATVSRVPYEVGSSSNVVIRGALGLNGGLKSPLYVVDGEIITEEEVNLLNPDSFLAINVLKDADQLAVYGARGANGVIIITTNKGQEDLNQVQARKNLQETAFFYPQLKTDEKGNIKIQFTVPESLTQWKFMATAHTPELNTGYYEAMVRTQKDLMVVPNPPRFLREGDQITFSSKVTNLSEKALNGQAKLMLFDAFTMQPIDAEFGNTNATQNISVSQGNSQNVVWNLSIPKTHQAIVYRIVASAGDFSDGEESALPILSNRMMVTETLPIYIRENQTKTFRLDKLKNNASNSLDNFKLTFEMTTNPIWYAIFSLPYLREYPYECSEQVFSRLYGNLISQHIINSNPKIKTVFDDWNKKGELKSKLEQNEELKSLLLEETPWVRQAENEEEQMKRIAVLFDLNKMRNELQSAFQKLKGKQYDSGGFPWFNGGDESRYITTHIVSGFGHLEKMGIDLNENLNVDVNEIIENAIDFIDEEMAKEYDKYLANKKLTPSIYNGIQYLYARSYFLEKYPLDDKGTQLKNYFLKEFEKEDLSQNLQTQAMLALIYNRYGQKDKAEKLLRSIKDNSTESDEMGMYWKSNVAGWYWYQAPIETQAILIEAFDEVMNDIESVESMKVWLLKNRQTNQWESTKATTEAVFALMSTGKDWTNAEEGISVKIGGENLDLKKLEKAPQSGSGYVKTSWNKAEIKPEMATIDVQKTSPGVAWGAMYWQYFEDLDKITVAETGVKFRKELFLKKNSDKGPVLTKISSSTPIQIGDLITVRLEIQTDREMEFVHIKDMRASGFEPVNVLSSYKWQQGMGYYESTRDAATSFFIDRMPKGTYVFEYDVRANNAGNFSNGITSLQNMYAPELSSHSEGIRVEIK